MEWLAENWYIFPVVLAAVIFLLGYKVKGSKDESVHTHKHGEHNIAKKHESGHGCC